MYLSGSGGEGCIGALIQPRVVLSSGQCIERVRPTTASWGSSLEGELIQRTALRRGPSGKLALLKLERVAPLPHHRELRPKRSLLSNRRHEPLFTGGGRSELEPYLSSGYASVIGTLERLPLAQRDALNAVLYLSLYSSNEGVRRFTQERLRKAALWVPQRSDRDPLARIRALRALSHHPGGALMISRSRALEAISTRSGLISLSSHYQWIMEVSEALSAQAIKLKRERS